jgi:hypothetical protein
VLEELNDLVAQLKESEKAEEAFRKESSNREGTVSQLEREGAVSEHIENGKELSLQIEEMVPNLEKRATLVKEESRSLERSLDQPVHLHPDRLAKGLKKITSSFLRRGSKDKTEVLKCFSMYNSPDIAASIDLSKSWHPSKTNDHPNAKISDRQGSDQFYPQTEQSERNVKVISVKATPAAPKWSFLKGKERSDFTTRQSSKASQRARTYSEGTSKIIRHKAKDRVKEKPKEKSRQITSDPVAVQRDEKLVLNSSPEKTIDNQCQPPETKETRIAPAQTSVEDETAGADDTGVKEQVGKESEGKITDDSKMAVEDINENAESKTAASNPLPTDGAKSSPATATSDEAKPKESVIFYKHSKNSKASDLDKLASSAKQRNVSGPANVDKVKETTSHEIDGRLPQPPESKARPKEYSEYKESARRHHLRSLKQKDDAKKSNEKKPKESTNDKNETGKPKESATQKNANALDVKKTTMFSQRSTSPKNTTENRSAAKNNDIPSKENPLVVRQRSSQKHPHKVARSSPKVQADDRTESTTSKVKRERSKSLSKTRGRPSKEEKVNMTEQREPSSKATGERSKLERREQAPTSSSGNNTLNNILTKKVRNASTRQGSKDIIRVMSTPSRIDAIMQETASVHPKEKSSKQKLSSKAKKSSALSRRSRRTEDDGSDSHSNDSSSTYSSDDDDSVSVFSEGEITGSSDEQSSNSSSTNQSDASSDPWSPWKVWSM